MRVLNLIFIFLVWIIFVPLRFIKNAIQEVSSPKPKDVLNTPSFQEFLKVNEGVWKKETEAIRFKSDEKILFEAMIEHPAYILTNLIIVRHMMHVYQMPAAALMNRPEKKWEDLFRSFGITEFHYLDDRRKSYFYLLGYVFKSLGILFKIKDIGEFLKFKYNEVSLGKIVYDDYLRTTGFGTVGAITFRILDKMARALSYIDYIEEIYAKNKFSVLIQAEKQFIPSSLICQVALRRGIVLYSRGGGRTSFTLRRYDRLNQIYTSSLRPSFELFDFIAKEYRHEAIQKGGEIIFSRFGGEAVASDIPDAAYAFKKGDDTLTREKFCQRMGWDPKKPIVGVLANNLIDGVFTDNWELFRDYLTWLRETLKYIRDVKDVNWFVKPHPTDRLYSIKTTVAGQFDELVKDCSHVKLYPDDLTASSLPQIVDAIITVRGSAGLEYSCFGIPCIIAGEAFYTGFGFTTEPQTPQEYFQILSNIRGLKRLSKEQIERAKIFAYIDIALYRVPCSLIPQFSPYDDYQEEKLWQDATKLISEIAPQSDKLLQMMRIQVKNKYRLLLNYDWMGGGVHQDTPAQDIPARGLESFVENAT